MISDDQSVPPGLFSPAKKRSDLTNPKVVRELSLHSNFTAVNGSQ